MEEFIYRIERFDGNKKYVQEYVVPREPNKTVLWGLIKIKEEMDPTLAFTASCRSGVCGACAVRVNGHAVLACETPLDKLAARLGTNTLEIAPLANFRVIRDLVVDWEPKAERLASVKPWLIPKDEFSATAGCRQSAAEFKAINVQADCILCGACASECSKLAGNQADFLEPFAYVKASKFVADSRDGAPLEHLKPAIGQGAWKCLHCEECTAKCPKGVAPSQDLARLKQAAVRHGMTGGPGPRHAEAFYGDITGTGRLNETMLAMKTEGWLRAAARLPFALRLLRRGKLPLHLPKAVEGISDVRRIARRAREEDRG